VELAGNSERRELLRNTLFNNMQVSGLCDGKAFTEDLERICRDYGHDGVQGVCGTERGTGRTVIPGKRYQQRRNRQPYKQIYAG